MSVGGSDHAPVAVTVQHPSPVDTRPKLQFLPTPHRISDDVLRNKCVAYYKVHLPPLAKRFARSKKEEDMACVYADLVQVTKTPWETMAAPKPARFRKGWTRQLDGIAKQRTKFLRKQHSRTNSEQDRKVAGLEARRLTKLIARLLKQQRHKMREQTADKLASAADRRDSAAVSKILKDIRRQSADASRLGDSLEPKDFTAFFADKEKPPKKVPLQKFVLDPEFRDLLCVAIKRSKKGKAPGPDGIPCELYKLVPDLFAEVFYELFAACGRMAAVVPGWDLSILIPIFKKGDMALPVNYRPLRLIQALKKIFGIALDGKVRAETDNELAQFGFQRGVSSLEALVQAIAHTQIADILTIAVDQKGAYDTVNRYILNDADQGSALLHNSGISSDGVARVPCFYQGRCRQAHINDRRWADPGGTRFAHTI